MKDIANVLWTLFPILSIGVGVFFLCGWGSALVAVGSIGWLDQIITRWAHK